MLDMHASFRMFQRKIVAMAAAKHGKLEIMEDFFDRNIDQLKEATRGGKADTNMQ
jgi:hypothetical protein